MSTTWKLTLEVQSTSSENTSSLKAAMITDCEIINKQKSFSIEIMEHKAKDLRAMWNTRIRGLIAVDSLMTVLDGLDHSEDSSTSNV
ncbi:MAG: hypothetical protein ISP82_01235 [Candidatus Poseidoniaceae archaeon]|nr:hypothetical protein [Candidatus Poseidoniaceae archaeon]MBL6895724.1 hypothetical protein [Candidatus Poseidoniaceae archaeon]